MGHDNLDFLKEGEMILVNAKVDNTTKPYFFLKDSISHLTKIGEAPIVESKGVVFETVNNDVMLLLMFRLNKDDNLIYCQWCNYYDKNYKNLLDSLIFSDKLNFCTINSENKKYATFECTNTLRFIMSKCSEKAKGHIWSNEDFMTYVAGVNNHYNNRVTLFHESKYHNM